MRKIFLLMTAVCVAFAASAQGSLRMLVGTYTEGTGSEGIYLYEFDPVSASASLVSKAAAGNPSFVVASADGSRVYCVDEYNDGREGVSSFELTEGELRRIGFCPLELEGASGADPCNLLLLDGALVSSNYTGGSLAAFRLDARGSAGSVSQFFDYSVGKEQAHMHCAVLSPDRRYIFAANLGNDCIHRFEYRGGESPLGRASVAWKHHGLRKAGPRHMVFSADGRFAYLLCELGDLLVAFKYNDGKLRKIQSLKAYDGGGRGSADIHLSPDGRFLYTSHRLKEDGIAVFRVNPASGKVSKVGFRRTGVHPRNFAISPDGRFLLCACRDSDRIEIYSIDPQTGLLSDTGKTIEVKAPVCIQWL